MSPQPLRVAFFGSPEFALPVLNALHNHHDVRLVVTQPDRPAGRGMAVRAPAAARRARELDIRLEQPTRLKGNEPFHALLRELDVDVAVTAAYGRILPASLLQVPRHGFLNVHASLLPKYRGAAPVQWALIEGEAETGVTIMQTDVGLDTGPVRLQRRLPIEPADDAGSLLEKLSALGAETLLEALSLLGEGTLPLAPQDDAAATLAPPLKAEDGWIRWHEPAQRVVDRHRGVAAWPGSSFEFQGQRVKVEALMLAGPADANADASVEPGTVLSSEPAGVVVAAGAGSVLLQSVKPPGKRAMNARDWANGRGVKRGVRLG
ncbi:MAG: methionyl-tRNA formyltransferase [Trueperaceae bacterium]